MRVVTLPMSDRIPPSGDEPGVPPMPVIPAAELIKREGNSGWYSVHFKPMDKLWVMLFEAGPGEFVAFPNEQRLMSKLPGGTRWDPRQWRYWQVEASSDDDVTGSVIDMGMTTRDPSVSQPWTKDGVTITKARPVLRSSCGHLRTNLLRDLEGDGDD